MEVTLSSEPSYSDAESISGMVDFFVTPTIIKRADIKNISRVNSPYLHGLTLFTCDSSVYLLFTSDLQLEPEQVLKDLKLTFSIKDPKGNLCTAKDDFDDVYGVSPDHDPFHDDYTYLWYCGDSTFIQEKAK